MMEDLEKLSVLAIFIYLGLLVLSVYLIIAFLTIPKIARYQKAQAKILALMAKKMGVEPQSLFNILYHEKMMTTVDSNYVYELLKKPIE